MDVHSYSRPDQIRVRHLDLDLTVSFDRKTLEGSCAIHFDRHAPGDLVLDTRDLTIHSVDHADSFELGQADPVLGAPLRIVPSAGVDSVRVHYSTSPAASGLQWLDAPQTAGKHHPFLYTQSQAIHARSWIPLQDTPGVRVTFTAKIAAPEGMRAVMGADMQDGGFRMEQPVPSYLISLAVGDLSFRELGPRSGVYAEPSLIDAAAHEFADTEAMIAAVEAMYGPYRWGRYDLLVLPPSFPFGGMENPRLTFTTPTILAGDRSLVSLVAHELAHSWSGNLVTNATWSDFWLNEGFTVYLERRILEKVYGTERAEMEAVLGRRELEREMNALPASDTVLHIDLEGRDPDDGCTLVPYEKGALMLRTIEQTVGRERFDAFLHAYFDHFAFQSITTGQFLEYLRAQMMADVPVDEWIFRSGVPAGAAEPQSSAFDRIESADRTAWTTHQWLHFLRTRQNPDMAELDREFQFTQTGNSEILAQWLLMAVQQNYQPAMPRMVQFLCSVGRRKFLKPLYAELMKTPDGQEYAREIYRRARPGYHPIAQTTIDAMLR
ncbi:MAG TPA: M1 family metallopeptidase [Candidatus Sulfopaludibacter sp.]|jgi:aminopeptidase N|nr:M1 family metallopeptidase [Candidatus Sulfopaludibacter sp.]